MVLRSVRSIPILVYLGLILIPIWLAVERLMDVTGSSPFSAILSLSDHPLGSEALYFSFIQAILSAILTIAIGLPIAWWLGRHQWKHLNIIRAALTLPFVTPTIVAAMGFLALFKTGGPIESIGIDLRFESGFIGWLSSTTGIENSGHIIALLLAHAWFNLALVIRFVEPRIATIPPRFEESIRLLPIGRTRLNRARYFWWPMLRTSIGSAFMFTFIFSFTSFALVRWLAPDMWTLEALMAVEGGAAGIPNYRTEASLLVLGGATLQGIILLFALGLAGYWEQKKAVSNDIVSESFARKTAGKPSRVARIGVSSSLVFALAPLISMLISSVHIRDRTNESYRWSTEAWDIALTGDLTYVSAIEALSNSIVYAIACMFVSVLLGYAVASSIHAFESKGKKKIAMAIDVLSMLPLALSGVMVGLGVLLGVLKVWPELFQWYGLPVIPHAMLTTPFVIRILLPALRSLDSSYDETAAMLGYSNFQRFTKVRIPLMKSSLVVAATLSIAFSLGEFGASWILLRSGSWDTLPILVDQLMARPKYFQLVEPVAMATASLLMMITFVLFVITERFREHQGGGF
jgi:thiamine transport system permease protein